MSNVEKKSPVGHVIALIVVIALNILWVITDRIAFARGFSLATVLSYADLVIAVFYAVYGYKKPHGNLMRYLLMLFVVAAAGMMYLNAASWPSYVNAAYLVLIMTVAYMCGRLDHYKQNVVICAVALICNGVISYYLLDRITGRGMPLTFVNFFGCTGAVTTWLAIAAGYILRYREHKEAGLADKN